MCLVYNLKAPFEKLTILPLVNELSTVGYQEELSGFWSQFPGNRGGMTGSHLATCHSLNCLPVLPTRRTLTLTANRMWNFLSVSV